MVNCALGFASTLIALLLVALAVTAGLALIRFCLIVLSWVGLANEIQPHP